MSSQQLQSFMIPGAGYVYTGTPVDNDTLAAENTLATGAIDDSGSTGGFAEDCEKCVKAIVRSLRKSPQADKLLYRHLQFDTTIREIHGFRPLSECNEADYDGIHNRHGGMTALYNSCENALLSTHDYAEQLASKHYVVNGIAYIVTDGANYLPGQKSKTANDVKLAVSKLVTSEALESMITILIGINNDSNVQAKLRDFHAEAGFTQYVPLEDANDDALAKLANFVSQSIQAQSKKAGSGGPSQSITF